MGREPGDLLDLAAVVAGGRLQVGPGRYETLLHVGDVDGHPVFTFTCPWRAGDEPYNAPTAPYLRMLAEGLREGHGWDTERIANYLAGLQGAHGHWTPAAVAVAIGTRQGT